ncbi:MAG TPA: hypothetical protein VHB21_03670 [Minicystis sp.]|nr:hypothetical protein [Minicystis sp.]
MVPLIQCIDQFYNPKMYNWLSFKNNCNVAVHVVFVPNVPGKGGSAMHLKPGQADSTGFSKKEVDARAGFSLAVCAEGYHPVEANGQYWTHARETYSCKKD